MRFIRFAAASYVFILKIAFTTPLKHFGILKTTIFIQPYRLSLYHHLNKQRYPNKISNSISIIATNATGKNIPEITPRQNASDVRPIAFAQPCIQKFIITDSHLPPAAA